MRAADQPLLAGYIGQVAERLHTRVWFGHLLELHSSTRYGHALDRPSQCIRSQQ